MGVNLRETLPAIRAKRGLTQEELGKRARIGRTDIVAFESGTKKVGPARLQRLALALKVSPVELGADDALPTEEYRSFQSRLEAVETLTGENRQLIEAVVRRLAVLEGGLEPPVRATGRRRSAR